MPTLQFEKSGKKLMANLWECYDNWSQDAENLRETHSLHGKMQNNQKSTTVTLKPNQNKV